MEKTSAVSKGSGGEVWRALASASRAVSRLEQSTYAGSGMLTVDHRLSLAGQDGIPVSRVRIGTLDFPRSLFLDSLRIRRPVRVQILLVVASHMP